jgi:enterobactin synthetase component D
VRTDLATPHGAIVIVEGTLEPRALGRAALREALAMPDADIASDDRGAPVMPAGWLGSLSHKVGRAAALVAPDDGSGARIGVDLEHAVAPRQPIERRILSPREPIADRREVTLYFAVKEAIYKAIDPFLRRYVGFTEVEVSLAERRVTTALPVAIDIWWCEHAGMWLATAKAKQQS